MSKHQRFFTVEEANALIPRLGFLVGRVKSLKEEIVSQAPELEPVLSKAKFNGGYKKGINYVLKLNEFYSCLNSITEIGCILKDIDLGLLDFPSVRGGREVYLCWKLGEDRVRFWHELDTGFAGRKPL
ncbi:MAG TPA: DUF2203 domain-containing protein [Thermodesulfobacteriota bacterium]|nr:DUF2203 domain-containing protein [Thermodesulfobacteriota bacterium]